MPRLLLVAAPILLASACRDPVYAFGDPCPDGSDLSHAARWYADDDGDGYGDLSDDAVDCDRPEGYADNAQDCDDSDAAVSPAATEVCNGIDDNCNQQVDEAGAEGWTSWYEDRDQDGWGDDATATGACEAPGARWTDQPGDCDDDDWTVHPGADEWCNGTDDDCDEEVDEEAVDAEEWPVDADGDGHGHLEEVVLLCECVEGCAESADDCDDDDPSTYPGAREWCDDTDHDCDGDPVAGAADAGTWYTDDDGDGYGDSDLSTTSCDPPPGTSDMDGDCDDADPEVYPGSGDAVLLTIRVCIDGSDYLMIQGDQVWWEHNSHTKPALHTSCDLTEITLDDEVWELTWTGDTSSATTIDRELSASEVTVSVVVLEGRGPVTVTEQPTSANGYTAAVFFDDRSPGGADTYEVEVWAPCE